MPSKPLTYKDAGVDIDAGNALVDKIKPLVARTRRAEVMAGLGGFGGLFALDTDRFSDPVLVSGTDGVGTKLKLAQMLGRHETIGIDLVAMCVNDVLVQGAEPLFFLDYFACGKLDVNVAADVVAGIAEGCTQAGAALIGGETAEMPDMYPDGEYDIAGFCVGAVNRADLIDGKGIQAGDVLIGIASSGPHSNGYSLIRRVLEHADGASISGRPAAETLLEPTRIYVRAILGLMRKMPVKGLAHVTGGGITENLPRVLPEGLGANIDRSSWTPGPVFDWLAEHGQIADDEMLRTFNCGIGMIVAVDKQHADSALQHLQDAGEEAVVLGGVSDAHVGVRYL